MVSAVVAEQALFRLVIGQAHRTARTAEIGTAASAMVEIAKAAPVQKQQDLPAPGQNIAHFRYEPVTQASATALDLHDLKPGQGPTGKALFNAEILKGSLFPVVPGLHAWGCTAHDQARPMFFGPEHGDLPCVVARACVGFITALMLLIYNYEANGIQGCKYGASGNR